MHKKHKKITKILGSTGILVGVLSPAIAISASGDNNYVELDGFRYNRNNPTNNQQSEAEERITGYSSKEHTILGTYAEYFLTDSQLEDLKRGQIDENLVSSPVLRNIKDRPHSVGVDHSDETTYNNGWSITADELFKGTGLLDDEEPIAKEINKSISNWKTDRQNDSWMRQIVEKNVTRFLRNGSNSMFNHKYDFNFHYNDVQFADGVIVDKTRDNHHHNYHDNDPKFTLYLPKDPYSPITIDSISALKDKYDNYYGSLFSSNIPYIWIVANGVGDSNKKYAFKLQITKSLGNTLYAGSNGYDNNNISAIASWPTDWHEIKIYTSGANKYRYYNNYSYDLYIDYKNSNARNVMSKLMLYFGVKNKPEIQPIGVDILKYPSVSLYTSEDGAVNNYTYKYHRDWRIADHYNFGPTIFDPKDGFGLGNMTDYLTYDPHKLLKENEGKIDLSIYENEVLEPLGLLQVYKDPSEENAKYFNYTGNAYVSESRFNENHWKNDKSLIEGDIHSTNFISFKDLPGGNKISGVFEIIKDEQNLTYNSYWKEFIKTVNKDVIKSFKDNYENFKNKLEEKFNGEEDKEQKISEFLTEELKNKFNEMIQIWDTLIDTKNIIKYNYSTEEYVTPRLYENESSEEYRDLEIPLSDKITQDLNEIKEKFKSTETLLNSKIEELNLSESSADASDTENETVAPSEKFRALLGREYLINNSRQINWNTEETYIKYLKNSLLKDLDNEVWKSDKRLNVENTGIPFNSLFTPYHEITSDNTYNSHNTAKTKYYEDLLRLVVKHSGSDDAAKPLYGRNLAKMLANSGYIKTEYINQIKDYDFKFVGGIGDNTRPESEVTWQVNVNGETKLAKFLVYLSYDHQTTDNIENFANYLKDYHYHDMGNDGIDKLPSIWIVARGIDSTSNDFTNTHDELKLYGIKIPVFNKKDDVSSSKVVLDDIRVGVPEIKDPSVLPDANAIFSYFGKNVTLDHLPPVTKENNYKYTINNGEYDTNVYALRLRRLLAPNHTSTPNDIYLKFKEKGSVDNTNDIIIKLLPDESGKYGQWSWESGTVDRSEGSYITNTSKNTIWKFSDDVSHSTASMIGWFKVNFKQLITAGVTIGKEYEPVEIGWLSNQGDSQYHFYDLTPFIDKSLLSEPNELNVDLTYLNEYRVFESAVNETTLNTLNTKIENLKRRVSETNKQNDPSWTGYISDIETKQRELANIMTIINDPSNSIKLIKPDGNYYYYNDTGENIISEIPGVFDSIKEKYETLSTTVEEKLSEVETNNEAMRVEAEFRNFETTYDYTNASWSKQGGEGDIFNVYDGEKWYLNFELNREYLKIQNLDEDDGQVLVALKLSDGTIIKKVATKTNIDDQNAKLKIELPLSEIQGKRLTLDKYYIGTNKQEELSDDEFTTFDGSNRNYEINGENSSEFNNLINTLYSDASLKTNDVVEEEYNDFRLLALSLDTNSWGAYVQNALGEELLNKYKRMKSITKINDGTANISKNPEVLALLTDFKNSIKTLKDKIEVETNKLHAHKRILDHLTEDYREFKDELRPFAQSHLYNKLIEPQINEFLNNNLENYKSLPSSEETVKLGELQDKLIKWKEFFNDIKSLIVEFDKVKTLSTNDADKEAWFRAVDTNSFPIILLDESKLTVSNNVISNKDAEYLNSIKESMDKLKLLKQKFELLDSIKNEAIKANQLEELKTMINDINEPTEENFGANVKEKLEGFKRLNAQEASDESDGYKNITYEIDTTNGTIEDFVYKGATLKIKAIVTGNGIDFSNANNNKIVINGRVRYDETKDIIGTFAYDNQLRVITISVPLEELIKNDTFDDDDFTILEISNPIQDTNSSFNRYSVYERMEFSKINKPAGYHNLTSIDKTYNKNKDELVEFGFTDEEIDAYFVQKGIINKINLLKVDLNKLRAANNILVYINDDKVAQVITSLSNRYKEIENLLESSYQDALNFAKKYNSQSSVFKTLKDGFKNIYNEKQFDSPFYDFIKSLDNNNLIKKLPINPNEKIELENARLLLIMNQFYNDVKDIVKKLNELINKVKNSVALNLNMSDEVNKTIQNYPNIIPNIDTFIFNGDTLEYSLAKEYTDQIKNSQEAVQLLDAKINLANEILFDMKLTEEQKQELINNLKLIIEYKEDEEFGKDIKSKQEMFKNANKKDEESGEKLDESKDDNDIDTEKQKQEADRKQLEKAKRDLANRIYKEIKKENDKQTYLNLLKEIKTLEDAENLNKTIDNYKEQNKTVPWYKTTTGKLILSVASISVIGVILAGIFALTQKIKNKKSK